jgi:hypothetical protein
LKAPMLMPERASHPISSRSGIDTMIRSTPNIPPPWIPIW